MASHKILVIDDSKVIRMRVREMLPPGNFEIVEATDGEEGLKLIRQARPNLIMLDFLLPKVSGWEVYQQIQGNAELRKIPLVLMSGRKEEVTEKIPEPFKHFAFIEKPFEKKQLIDAIKLAMRTGPAPAPVGAPAAEAKAQPAAAAAPAAGGASNEQIAQMQAEMKKMQAEIDGLKKQLAQIVTVIKQKLK
ncbi:MAG: response regulator [Oscillatoria princeps RMCB-10]|nr:response regulator [Oscillatoria princeps RMCB-10]